MSGMTTHLIGCGLEMGGRFGPHYHAWADNKYLLYAAASLRELACARKLPPQIRRWEQAFRWFCGETRVVFEPDQFIGLPPRDTLF